MARTQTVARRVQTSVTPELAEYLAGLDMLYLGTANSSGQPCIQYRGGLVGFLNVLDERTLAFADFGGNRQYITVGILSENPMSVIFLMDYANSRRIKLWGEAEVIEAEEELLVVLQIQTYGGRVERAV